MLSCIHPCLTIISDAVAITKCTPRTKISNKSYSGFFQYPQFCLCLQTSNAYGILRFSLYNEFVYFFYFFANTIHQFKEKISCFDRVYITALTDLNIKTIPANTKFLPIITDEYYVFFFTYSGNGTYSPGQYIVNTNLAPFVSYQLYLLGTLAIITIDGSGNLTLFGSSAFRRNTICRRNIN